MYEEVIFNSNLNHKTSYKNTINILLVKITMVLVRWVLMWMWMEMLMRITQMGMWMEVVKRITKVMVRGVMRKWIEMVMRLTRVGMKMCRIWMEMVKRITKVRWVKMMIFFLCLFWADAENPAFFVLRMAIDLRLLF